jgi:hypothetical protein
MAVGLGIAVWLIALWLLMGGDTVRERLIVAALRDDTQFTQRYSEAALDSLSFGHSISDVRTRLGEPFRSVGSDDRPCWIYSRSPSNGYFRARAVCFADGKVSQIVRRWFNESF